MLDCLLTYGERRPEWTRPPSRRELAEMLWHRARALRGTRTTETTAPKAEATIPWVPEMAPPGTPPDHPKVLDGSYYLGTDE